MSFFTEVAFYTRESFSHQISTLGLRLEEVRAYLAAGVASLLSGLFHLPCDYVLGFFFPS
jgi:hypothetical protein